MDSLFHRFQWGCVLLLLFSMASCSFNSALRQPQKQKDFLKETAQLERTAREDSKTSVRAQSHLQLAFLYLDHRNPQLNYPRALQEMESYLSLAPAKTQTDDFQNWLTVLQEIKTLHANLEKVNEANKSLRNEVAGYKETNHKMRQTIERLKSLDLQMEEKRSLMK
jgi:ribosomal protein S17E